MISFNMQFCCDLEPLIDDFPVVRVDSILKCINFSEMYLGRHPPQESVLNTMEYASNWT